MGQIVLYNKNNNNNKNNNINPPYFIKEGKGGNSEPAGTTRPSWEVNLSQPCPDLSRSLCIPPSIHKHYPHTLVWIGVAERLDARMIFVSWVVVLLRPVSTCALCCWGGGGGEKRRKFRWRILVITNRITWNSKQIQIKKQAIINTSNQRQRDN